MVFRDPVAGDSEAPEPKHETFCGEMPRLLASWWLAGRGHVEGV